MAGQFGAHGGMAMKINIGLHARGHFGGRGLWRRLDLLALFKPRRFLRGDITLVDIDVAALAYLDIYAHSLALGRFAMLSFADVITLGHDDDLAPPRVQHTLPTS